MNEPKADWSMLVIWVIILALVGLFWVLMFKFGFALYGVLAILIASLFVIKERGE